MTKSDERARVLALEDQAFARMETLFPQIAKVAMDGVETNIDNQTAMAACSFLAGLIERKRADKIEEREND